MLNKDTRPEISINRVTRERDESKTYANHLKESNHKEQLHDSINNQSKTDPQSISHSFQIKLDLENEINFDMQQN